MAIEVLRNALENTIRNPNMGYCESVERNSVDKTLQLSIIVPAYNMDEWLQKCVVSLEKQAGIDFEVIIINDGSVDKTKEVAGRLSREYSNVRFINQDNTGLYHARINGVRDACGEYVTFVDADDTIVENFYGRILDKMNASHADISEFGLIKLNRGQEVYRFSPKESVYDSNEAVRRQLEKDAAMCSNCNKIYRRKLFDDIPFDEDIRCYEEDKLINIKVMCNAKKVMSLSEIGYIYDTRDGSITTSKKDFIASLTTNRCIYDFVKKMKPEISFMAARDLCAHIAYSYLNLYSMDLDADDLLMTKRQLSEEFKRVFYGERLEGYRPKSSSNQRNIMIRLFRISPAVTEMVFRILNR